MQKKRILIIEKDFAIQCAVKNCMQGGNADIVCADSLLESLRDFVIHNYCLVMIGIHPAEKKEIELLRQVQAIKYIPILAIVPHLTSEEKVVLFRAGVSAYIEKPVDIAVCKEQADALIRLSQKLNYEQSQHVPLIFGNELMIEPHYRQVIVNGVTLKLTRKEFDLFHYLARHPGQVFSCEHLYDRIWKEDSSPYGVDTIKTHIKNIRKKLASADKDYIQNVWGVGYKFALMSTTEF